MLETHQLSAGYLPTSPIVRDINLTFQPGKIYALVGPNGCGKSTLLKTIALLNSPLTGNIFYKTKPLSQLPSKQKAQIIAMLCQRNPQPEGMTIQQLVEFGRHAYTGFWGRLSQQDYQYIDRMIELCQLHDIRHHYLTDLSGGQNQRGWLAMTLAQDSRYILLDEPTTYLDLHHQVELMELLQYLKASGKTPICVLHDLNQACRYCDEIIVLSQGQIYAQGTPSHIMTANMLSDVFWVNAHISPAPISQTPMMTVLNNQT
ncbi:ATP-binding cassette domain-containing protein [Celerinatantimonas sp. YJH-8]|uniref:ATP-binding cassette domain-containing protein n=1 Tax=Celerinatantimonas sp. YJH-8 TaxID=3228714 RepID=UPI0038C05690